MLNSIKSSTAMNLYPQEELVVAKISSSPLLNVCGGGSNFTTMLSQCDDCVHRSECYFNRDGHMFSYGSYDLHELHDHNFILVDKDRWRRITRQRPDAYNVICVAFNMGPLIKAKIEDNSEDPTHRFADVLHHLYHSDNSITWRRIITQIIYVTKDYHLAEVIRNNI